MDGQPIKEERLELSLSEATEFCEYKKEKSLRKVRADMRKCVYVITPCGKAELAKRFASAKSLSLSAVKIPSAYLPMAKRALENSCVFIDCIVGGTGETHTKVKVYETKTAIKNGAREITLNLSKSALETCQFELIQKEIKAVVKAAKKRLVKLYVESSDKQLLFRLSRIAIECGVSFFCLPLLEGLISLQDELHGACLVEFIGVTAAQEYTRLIESGMARVGTECPSEINDELVENARKTAYETLKNTRLQNSSTASKKGLKSVVSYGAPPSAIAPNILFSSLPNNL